MWAQSSMGAASGQNVPPKSKDFLNLTILSKRNWVPYVHTWTKNMFQVYTNITSQLMVPKKNQQKNIFQMLKTGEIQVAPMPQTHKKFVVASGGGGLSTWKKNKNSPVFCGEPWSGEQLLGALCWPRDLNFCIAIIVKLWMSNND